MQVEKTVFISYRRTNEYTARAVYQDLTTHGYDVFLDYETIDSGAFEQVIFNQIAARAHFLIILTPSALERCNEPGDWLRREIEHALNLKRNIVPLMFDNFNFGAVEKYLTGKLMLMKSYNGVEVPRGYFNEAMERLRNRYLSKPLEMILHPTPPTDMAVVQEKQSTAARQPTVTEQQLTAEEWFEQGRARDETDYEGRIADFTEAIRLNPTYASVYYDRGFARADKGDLDGAIADFTEAIHLNPRDADAYYIRGAWLAIKGDLDGAIGDFTEVIHLDPQDADAYYGRGTELADKGDLDGAIADFTEAIRLDPQDADTYLDRGVAYNKKDNHVEANTDYQKYIDLGGLEADKVRHWIRENEQKLKRN